MCISSTRVDILRIVMTYLWGYESSVSGSSKTIHGVWEFMLLYLINSAQINTSWSSSGKKYLIREYLNLFWNIINLNKSLFRYKILT